MTTKLRCNSGLELYFGPLMSDKIRYVPVAKPVLEPGVFRLRRVCSLPPNEWVRW